MNLDGRKVTGGVLLTCGVVLVYWQVLRKLVYDWGNDGNYSHGFLIIPLALYFVWERRARLTFLERERRPS